MDDFNLIDPDNNFEPLNIQCDYHNRSTLKHFIESESGLNILCVNIRSVRKNFDDLLASLISFDVNFHVIVLCETWLQNETEWCPVSGYSAFHSIRQDKKGGGVTVLVSDSVRCNLVDNLTINDIIIETCCVELTFKKKSILILGVYRPPNSSIVSFNSSLFGIINENPELFNLSCLIAGDFNIDLGNDDLSDSESEFIDFLHAKHFMPAINVPTRITNCSATIIDHIWTNSLYFKSGVVVADISDHYPTFITLPMNTSSDDFVYSRSRNHSPNNIIDLKNRILDFVNCLDGFIDYNCETQTNILCNGLYDIYNLSCPIIKKRISLKRASKPWLTQCLLRKIDYKHRLYRELCAGIGNVEHYKKYKNNLTNLLRISKNRYFSQKFSDSLGNSSASWKFINRLLSRKPKRNEVSKLLDSNDQVITDHELIANEFNAYFTSIAGVLDDQIPQSNIDPTSYINRLPNSFVLAETDDSEVYNVINSFKNKGCHTDSIPVFVYKLLADILSPVIARLINKSFAEGVFPSILKLARIIPIHKKGPKDRRNNYRPISTLHFLSKIFERIMDKRIRSFFDRNSIISDNQFGFRKLFSTNDAILRFTDEVYNVFNSGRYMIAVFIDLSKAFDTVCHKILLRKLEYAGVRGRAWCWFRSYLSGRRQYVDVGGCRSATLEVSTGVPQGSILGPLLFNLYINDMSSASRNVRYVHFADDTTLFIVGDDPNDMARTLNAELHQLDLWLQCNRLSLNLDKTSFMLFSNKNKLLNVPITMRNINIVQVYDTMFLGVILDDRLSFKKHITCIVNKLSKTCGVMSRMRYFVPSSTMRMIYFSLVYPYINYCIVVWGCSNQTSLNRLRSVQNRCIKNICPSKFPLNTLYKQLKILPFDCIYKYTTLSKFIFYKLNPIFKYFNEGFTQLIFSHTHSTRLNTSHGLVLPRVIRSKYSNSFLFQAIRFWNSLPESLRVPMSLSAFKYKIKRFLICDMFCFLLQVFNYFSHYNNAYFLDVF